MEITLIRHFKTQGNLERRYIGTTDESLVASQIPEELQDYPAGEVVFISPLKRCKETADYIYPELSKIVIDDLKECDFGLFENKNYEELKYNPEYQKWLESEGKLPFPNGESHESFCNRCRKGFEESVKIASEKGYQNISYVVHGGTIMAIMEAFNTEGKTFYDYQVKNGHGYHLHMDNIDNIHQFTNVTEL